MPHGEQVGRNVTRSYLHIFIRQVDSKHTHMQTTGTYTQ